MSANYFNVIDAIINRLTSDDGKVARFAYTQAAFDNDIIEGVDTFNLLNEQNIPKQGLTDYSATLLDRGARSQGASIPRMAVNHFFGRLGYNINKISQKFHETIIGIVAAFAHNAFEYDSTAAYLTDDVIYVIGSISGVPTISYWQRTGVSPLTITGISPSTALQTDWTAMQTGTELSAVAAFSAPGYRHKYTLVDLTGGSYLTTTWYPVTSAPFPTSLAGTDYIRDTTMEVTIQAYLAGTVTGVSGTALAELSLRSRFTGWLSSSASLIMSNFFIKVSDGSDQGVANSPIGYSVLPIGKQAVIWLRGGSKYGIWDSFGNNYTIRTASYNNGSDAAITPVTVAPGVTYTPMKVAGIFSTPNAVNTDEAVNLSQVTGSIVLPIALVLNTDLSLLITPGMYTADNTVGNSLLHGPAASLGICEVMVTGDMAGAVATKQLLLQRSTGYEWTRILAGGVVIVDWFLSNNKDLLRMTAGFTLPTVGRLLEVHAEKNAVIIAQGTVDDTILWPTVGASTKGTAGKMIVPTGAKLTLRNVGARNIPRGAPVKIADPATLLPGAGWCAAWSPDGRYLAIAHDNSPFVTIYDWATGVPVKIANPATLPTGNGVATAWAPDGRYLVVGHNSSPFITIYDWITGSPVKIAAPAILPTFTVNGAAWSPDGRYLAIAHGSVPFVTIYDWATGVPVKITNPATLPALDAFGAAWSPDGRYLAISSNNSPYVTIYDWITGVPVKIADPATLPSGAGYSATWSPDGRYLVVGHINSPFMTIYDLVNGVPVKIANPTILPSYDVRSVAWSPDGRYLAGGNNGVIPIVIYDWITGSPVKIADPAILPPFVALGATWSPDGRYLVSSNFIIYDTSVAANNTWLVESLIEPQSVARSMQRTKVPYLFYPNKLFR